MYWRSQIYNILHKKFAKYFLCFLLMFLEYINCKYVENDVKLINNLVHRVENLYASGDMLLIGGFLFLSICFSLILFCIYKINVKQQKNHKNERYRTILWNLIAIKTMIPVPIISWAIYAIAVFCNLSFSLADWIRYAFILFWVIWCTLIWISRKIYRKIRKNEPHKPPTSFYK